MLEDLIRGLRLVDVDVDSVALADALWLCGRMAVNEDDGTVPDSAGRPTLPAAATDGGASAVDGAQAGIDTDSAEAESDVFDSPGAEGSRSAVVDSAGRGPALPGDLAVGRALRPLKRPFPHGREVILDVEASVQAYAQTGDLTPVLAPRPERWFHLDLIVDQSASMQVWQDVAGELLALLQQLGAFRTVHRWGLDTRSAVPVLYDPSGAPVRPDRLRDPHGRRLVTVFSDCVADGWHAPRMWQDLRSWAQSTATVLFNPLPSRLWPHTGLDGPIVSLTPAEPGARAADLGYTVPAALHMLSTMGLGQPGGWVPCPVVGISADAFGAWARMLMATSAGNGCEGVLIPLSGRLANPTDHTHEVLDSDSYSSERLPDLSVNAQQLLRAFRHVASEPARRLAVHCSTQTEISLPVLRAVQEALEPDSGVTELAELIVSGLFEHAPGSEGGDLRLRFRPGVREELHNSLAAEDAWQVRRALARFAERATARQPHPVTIAAENGDVRVPDDLAPFTAVSDRPQRSPGTVSPDATPQPTVVIMTALALEHGAVLDHLTDVETLIHSRYGTRARRGRLPGTPWRIALVDMGEGTLTAATLTERVLSWLEPEAVLFVGVAGGLKDDIEIGDVVVATKVYAIHGGKQTPDGFLDRPEAWRASHRLEQAAKEALRGRAHFKPIAVGDVVLTDADSDLTAHIKRTYNDAVAIEMESSGVAHAVHLAGDAGALIIRGISDKANADKSTEDGKGSQPRAAANAAAAAVALLRELEPKPTGLSYRADHSSLRRSAVSPPPTKRSDSSVQTQVQVHGLVRPVMLPPRLPDFIGRSAELDRLLALLAPAPDNHSSGIPLLVAAVTGMGGIGKTALAVEAAHRAQAMGWFPGGAIFINLQGYDDDPLTADQAVVPLLRLLGTHEQAVPERKEHQYDAYRTLLAHREDRMLLILDNASLPSQYLPLLPGTDHHRVLITSRDRPNALPVRVIDLEALAPDESVALVTGALHDANERDDRPSREPDALRELTALCGHLPLALQMAAALLRRRRYRGIATLVAEMKEAETPTSVLNSARLGTDAYGRALGNLPSVTPVTATEAEPIQVNRDADAAIPMSARVTRVIRIGLTGHRELPETVLPTVRAGIREALRGSTPAGALSTPAPGAAHLFTTIVLEYGVPLTSVIPGMDYERHLGDDAARASYRQLLRFCTERVELPYEPTHEEAYFAAGRYIVDHSDLLIAVWDGRPADGMDRTADVVAYARQTGVPVTVLWKPGVRRA